MECRAAIGLLGFVSLLVWGSACQRNTPEPTQPTDSTVTYRATPYPWKKPANFPEPTYNFAQNPLTYEGVRLGKMLFFEPALSHDGTITCAFCHVPQSAFAHTDHTLSHGIRDQLGPRNGLGLQNLGFLKSYFWDGGVVNLDLQPIVPIQNAVEMGDTLTRVLAKIAAKPNYAPMFQAAFGTPDVTQERFLKALSQYVLTLVSANAKYDRYVRNEAGGELTAPERSGLALFQQHCAGCHAGTLFTDQTFRNNGLLPNRDSPTPDYGRYAITLNETDRYTFRVPSLRNVERTMPYMHDGRFATLEAVLNHYANGVSDNPNLDPLLKKNGQPGIPLTKQEQADIIAFLYTLTDYTFLNNAQFLP